MQRLLIGPSNALVNNQPCNKHKQAALINISSLDAMREAVFLLVKKPRSLSVTN